MDISDQYNERIIGLIDWLGQTGKELESGIREQVPELAKELILRGQFDALFYITLFTLITLVGLATFKSLRAYAAPYRGYQERHDNWAEKYAALGGSRYSSKPEDLAAVAAVGREPRSPRESMEVANVAQWVVLGLTILFFILGAGPNIQELIRIKVAPRVYLVETASKWIQHPPR